MTKHIQAIELTRRTFLVASSAAAGVAALATLPGCGGGSSTETLDQTKAYRLSTRNVSRASNASKLHAANMRFVSPEAADACRAHNGDNARVVSIDIKPDTWQQWFGTGATKVDLRKI